MNKEQIADNVFLTAEKLNEEIRRAYDAGLSVNIQIEQDTVPFGVFVHRPQINVEVTETHVTYYKRTSPLDIKV